MVEVDEFRGGIKLILNGSEGGDVRFVNDDLLEEDNLPLLLEMDAVSLRRCGADRGGGVAGNWLSGSGVSGGGVGGT